ncbi:MAG: FGGY-family carbohydrate kinase [Phycisphaerae bacterium]|nr:FGGY-family carbohydrate kinase [Phycisphaerae bacterium]
MAEGHFFLAIDLGAESGRGELVHLEAGKVSMEEVHRFSNRPVRLGGTLHWDFPFLFAEVTAALRAGAGAGRKIEGIGVDTWGVDFGLLGADGKLLGNPVHYRDGRTERIHDYSDPIMPRGKIFALTAYEPWAISSLFQLLAMQRDRSPLLRAAETFLNMPDLFNYFLVGIRANERSILNTSNLMGTDGQWATPVIQRFKLPEMFGRLVEPGTILGPLTDGVRQEVGGLNDVPVIATCGHDTSAAVAALPGEGQDWAFLSCGTWSILGCLIDKPVATPRCLELGFTNEYTLGGWYLARNILGLWLVQQLRRKWDAGGEPWDYDRMTAEAAKAKGDLLVDAADESFLAPADMEQALVNWIAKGGQAAPAGRGELVRCVLESLALEYARRLDSIGELVGTRPKTLYIVGGGTANKLLCQLTADACGIPVYAGADQCTALGNALVQAVGLGVLKNRDEIHQVMRNSFTLAAYEPKDAGLWADKAARYAKLVGGK